MKMMNLMHLMHDLYVDCKMQRLRELRKVFSSSLEIRNHNKSPFTFTCIPSSLRFTCYNNHSDIRDIYLEYHQQVEIVYLVYLLGTALLVPFLKVQRRKDDNLYLKIWLAAENEKKLLKQHWNMPKNIICVILIIIIIQIVQIHLFNKTLLIMILSQRHLSLQSNWA